MKPTPIQNLLHSKGWRLNRLEKELKKSGIPVSYPTLIKIKQGFNMISGKKKKYKPSKRILADIAKLFNVSPNKIYQDRSHE